MTTTSASQPSVDASPVIGTRVSVAGEPQEHPLRGEIEQHPLRGEIALCLSGGGYRAAAFHLGVLDLLHDLGLLERVRVISALSGGAIISARYVTALARGVTFERFRDDFGKSLLGNNPLAEAFDHLRRTGNDKTRVSLIRSLADAYAKPDFLGDLRFGELMESPLVPDDLIFGTTEFQGGKAFRFQMSRRSQPLVGNQPPLDIAKALAHDLRVADIVAASSCFPAAFEPMIFPDDFQWSRPIDEVRTDLSPQLAAGVPLMDGGIYDNQGVDGALAVYRRADIHPGLLLVSDSSPRVANLYKAPDRKRRGGLSLGSIRKLGWAFFVGSLLSTAALVIKTISELREDDLHLLDGLLFGLPTVVCMAVAWTLFQMDRRASQEQDRLREATGLDLWPNLKGVSLPDFLDMVHARLMSLVCLTNDIFMKRVRGLIQTSLRIGPRYRNRVLSNLIYDLDLGRPTLYRLYPWMQPKLELVALARTSEATPSALWFNDSDDFKNLVRCGRATTCFNILEFLINTESEALEDPASPEAKLFEAARALWQEINVAG